MNTTKNINDNNKYTHTKDEIDEKKSDFRLANIQMSICVTWRLSEFLLTNSTKRSYITNYRNQ